MEKAKEIPIPIIADSVLSPDFFYGDRTAIYFVTEDDLYGRITFEKLDSVKICRGEAMPYSFDHLAASQDIWVYQVENSRWQKERFDYENKHYGNRYEFGGDVNEMLDDFKHYLFSFHDQFIEVIARGFWFEQSLSPLFGEDLMEGHPFLPLGLENMESFEAHSLKTQIRWNPKAQEQLIHDAQFCSQKILQFALELEGNAHVDHTVSLSVQNGQLISTLQGYSNRTPLTFEGVVTLEEVLPYIKNYMEKVAERRLGVK